MIVVYGERVEQVEEMTYLRAMISGNGSIWRKKGN